MSQFGPGERRYEDGDFVLTPKKQGGRIVGAYIDHEPQHDDFYWDDDLNSWWSSGDEYLQHVYRVQVGNEIEPWPEDMLDPATVLDALIILGA